MMDKLISQQAAIEALMERFKRVPTNAIIAKDVIEDLPTTQPDIIRCKDCEYLCNEDGLRGMCWHINGFGTDVKDKYNSFCSWAERREG